MNSAKKQFFIIGAQRSGTTLLRLILNEHSQIAIPRESVSLMPLLTKKYLDRSMSGKFLKAFSDYSSSDATLKPWLVSWKYYYSDYFSQLDDNASITLRELIDDMFSQYCRSEGKSIWGNKTPSFFRKIDILHALFPDAKFVHIVRDGRDVFDSWRKRMPQEDKVSVAALDWNFKLYKIHKSFKKIPEKNKITIRYEDLLDNPKKTIESICFLLGVEFESSMLDFYKKGISNVGQHHSKLIGTPLNNKNKNKWKENLTIRERKIFNLLSGYYLRKYNYEIENNMLYPTDILFMLKSLIIGLPPRLIRVVNVKKVFEKAIKKSEKFD